MVSSLKELFDFCNWIVKKLEPDRPEILHALEKTQKLSHRMLRWQTRKYQSISGDVTGILWDYIAGITLHDVVAFYRIQKTLRACKKETMQLYTFAGEIDMEIAIASFRKSLPQWCCPSLQSDGAISVEKISHPLMADAIPNDFVLKKGVVLTGANASGKSTFMKAVAINVILAQTINTCVAKNMKMPAIQVMTSMALRDDVLHASQQYQCRAHLPLSGSDVLVLPLRRSRNLCDGRNQSGIPRFLAKTRRNRCFLECSRTIASTFIIISFFFLLIHDYFILPDLSLSRNN